MRIHGLTGFLAFCSALAVSLASAAAPGTSSEIVLASYRLDHPKTSGTGFVVRQPVPDQADEFRLILVTAAHALQKMTDAPHCSLVSRSKEEDGRWVAKPLRLKIRSEGKPLWRRHPQEDVAVILLDEEIGAQVNSIPIEYLATEEDWRDPGVEPGDLVRCVGFPHAAQFRPSPAGFPLTRLGCIASFPVVPTPDRSTFLVDFNVFEGDSGGPVYARLAAAGDGTRILGLIQGQHFLDERFKLVYQQGLIRKRLGIAIIAGSHAILQTIASIE